MILLDTHVLLRLAAGERPPRSLSAQHHGVPRISPASLLETQLLLEIGRVRLARATAVADLGGAEDWLLDDPPAAAWFRAAISVSWTRDPFDRLLVAHAALRGWRLATADRRILARLGPDRTIEV